MRVGVKAGLGLSMLVAVAAPASAKECVEPYGELVQVSEFETIVRTKPECVAMQQAAVATSTGAKQTEISLGSAMVVAEGTRSNASLLPALPDGDELAVVRRSAKRTVSCSDPAVCGRTRVAAIAKPFDCEDGRGYLVGISPGLTEVRIVDKCRHLMNPKGSVRTSAVPSVLAPDWELDQSPAPKPQIRRARINRGGCSDGDECSPTDAKPAGAKASPPDAESQSSGAFIVQASVFRSEWRVADLFLGGQPKLIATRNRRYQATPPATLIG